MYMKTHFVLLEYILLPLECKINTNLNPLAGVGVDLLEMSRRRVYEAQAFKTFSDIRLAMRFSSCILVRMVSSVQCVPCSSFNN